MTDDYNYYNRKYAPTKREHEQFRENLSDKMTSDLWTNARLMDSQALLRHVDEDAITKCRLSIYDKQIKATRGTQLFSEEVALVEKARGVTAGVSASKLEDRLDPREIPLDVSLEKLYFEVFGEGSDGSPVPDRPNYGYVCPCGLKMMMSWKTMRLHCPTCGRLTPPGKLKEEGVLNRI